MIQCLADSINQPIAMFASKGPVKGNFKLAYLFMNNIELILGMELTKIILKAIILLENAEIQVVGITSDGSSTNRTLWNTLSVCGKVNNLKNFFENPFDSRRKVYVFSDAPHLKTIGNRLFTKKSIKGKFFLISQK